MNKYFGIGLCSLLLSFSGLAQTVFTGTQEFDKQKKDGLQISIPVEKKQVEKEWTAFLGTFGTVTTSKGNAVISSANMPKISKNPINLMTKVTDNGNLISKFKESEKQSTTVFASFDLGGGSFLSASNEGYAEAEKLLKEFYASSMFNEEVRMAEKAQVDAQKHQEKMIKNGERLVKDVENNKKEYEKLLKKLDENKAQHEQLLRDIETNKIDQSSAKTVLEDKQKITEAIKARGVQKN